MVDPHAGTSYNPVVTAHQDLLKIAVGVEEENEAERLRIEGRKQRAKEVGKMLESSATNAKVEPVNGMPIAVVEEESESGDAVLPAKNEEKEKEPKRKSRKSRLAATRIKHEVRHCLSLGAIASRQGRPAPASGQLDSMDRSRKLTRGGGPGMLPEWVMSLQHAISYGPECSGWMTARGMGRLKVSTCDAFLASAVGGGLVAESLECGNRATTFGER